MTRHDRKLKRNARLQSLQLLDEHLDQRRAANAEQTKTRLEFERLHPVTAGLIPLVDYVPPR